MKPIIPPITPQSKGEQVANLQECLSFLIKKGVIDISSEPNTLNRPIERELLALSKLLLKEVNESTYGKATTELVHIFQIQQKLGDQLKGHELEPQSASRLHVVYLIEGEQSRQSQLPAKNIENALVRLQVSDQFQVKTTSSIAQSIEYLVNMTRVLQKVLQEKGLNYCKLALCDNGDLFEPNLKQFNLYATKSGVDQRNLTVSQLFARQLCCINGCSPQVAQAITEQFASDSYSFISKVSTEKGVEELGNIRIPCGRFKGVSVRRVGPALSKTLASYYTGSPREQI